MWNLSSIGPVILACARAMAAGLHEAQRRVLWGMWTEAAVRGGVIGRDLGASPATYVADGLLKDFDARFPGPPGEKAFVAAEAALAAGAASSPDGPVAS